MSLILLTLGILGIVALLVSLWRLTQAGPFLINDHPVSKGAWATLTFSCELVFVFLGILGFLGLRRFRSIGSLSRKNVVGEPATGGVPVLCELEVEFTAGDGKTARLNETVIFSSNLGKKPQEPVLYDPKDPRRAFLFDYSGPVRVTYSRGWEGRSLPLPRLRMGFVLLSLTLSPLLGFLLREFIKDL